MALVGKILFERRVETIDSLFPETFFVFFQKHFANLVRLNFTLRFITGVHVAVIMFLIMRS